MSRGRVRARGSQAMRFHECLRWPVWLAGSMLLALVGCTSSPDDGVASSEPVVRAAVVRGDQQLPPLTRTVAGQSTPRGWEPWIVAPWKAKTEYLVDRLDGVKALRARADSSASGLSVPLDVDPSIRRFIEWRWRIESSIAGADNAHRHKEDAPVRLMLAFDGDKSRLPVKDLMFFEQVQLLTRREMPYATLMYIWADAHPVGTIIRNPSTDRVRMIAVASGDEGARRWQRFRRDIVADYEAAFGEKPGRLVGLAIMTDSDNTKQSVTAWYDDIHLRAAPAAGG